MQENTIRNRELYQDKKEGMTYMQLYKKYGIAVNTIYRIVSRYATKERLGELPKGGNV